MYFLHQLHALAPGAAHEYEARLRDDWIPALAREPGARLCWSAHSAPGAIAYPEIVTLVAVRDGAALARLGERVRGGDLRDGDAALAGLRTSITTRVLAPLAFNPLAVDVDALPVAPAAAPTRTYMHDFVPPRIGMHRAYESAMEKVYMAMSDNELVQVVLWAGLETVAGGGPAPESLNISHIRSAAAVTQLLSFEAPRENKQLGNWMYDALALRDTWTTRIVRSFAWSPLQ